MMKLKNKKKAPLKPSKNTEKKNLKNVEIASKNLQKQLKIPKNVEKQLKTLKNLNNGKP